MSLLFRRVAWGIFLTLTIPIWVPISIVIAAMQIGAFEDEDF